MNEITQRQATFLEQASFLAPTLPVLDEITEVSDDIQKMLARCDALTLSMKSNGYQKPPSQSPPPPPHAYPDQNFLLEESEVSTNLSPSGEEEQQ
jgi:hypothetical protein